MDKRKKKGLSIVTGIFAVAFLAGCGSREARQQAAAVEETQAQESSGAEGRKIIVDDYAGRLLLEDADSLAYDKILAVLNTYAQVPDEKNLEEAKAELSAVRESFEKACLNLEPIHLEPGLKRSLKENGILTAEYEAFAGDRLILLSDFIENLNILTLYLDSSVSDYRGMEDFLSALEKYQRLQDIQRQYYYTSVNLWFAGWEQDAVLYVKEQVMDPCRSFNSLKFEWKDSVDEVEEQMMMYLDDMEAIVGEISAEIGKKEEELFQLQKEMGELNP